MKIKRTRCGKCQNVGNPYYGRETVTRSDEVAYRQLRTNNYSKKGGSDSMVPNEGADGVVVYPRSGL